MKASFPWIPSPALRNTSSTTRATREVHLLSRIYTERKQIRPKAGIGTRVATSLVPRLHSTAFFKKKTTTVCCSKQRKLGWRPGDKASKLQQPHSMLRLVYIISSYMACQSPQNNAPRLATYDNTAVAVCTCFTGARRSGISLGERNCAAIS